MKQKGLTLTELIIVIAIIGALFSLTVPAYTRMKMSSQEQRAIANLLLIKEHNLNFEHEII